MTNSILSEGATPIFDRLVQDLEVHPSEDIGVRFKAILAHVDQEYAELLNDVNSYQQAMIEEMQYLHEAIRQGLTPNFDSVSGTIKSSVTDDTKVTVTLDTDDGEKTVIIPRTKNPIQLLDIEEDEHGNKIGTFEVDSEYAEKVGLIPPPLPTTPAIPTPPVIEDVPTLASLAGVDEGDGDWVNPKLIDAIREKEEGR